MEETIKIRTINGGLIFKHTCEDNTIKITLEKAVELKINLTMANLDSADLSYSNLRSANLSCASLEKANLHCANLFNADLSYADLFGADLKFANLHGASLEKADLSRANLGDASLEDAILIDIEVDELTSFFYIQCPEEGSFVAWKKAGSFIVKLEVCKDALRSSATTSKCRCSKAKVLEIQHLDGSKTSIKEIESDYDRYFIYKVGKTVEVKDFDTDRWLECTSGIHFFMNREIAVKY